MMAKTKTMKRNNTEEMKAMFGMVLLLVSFVDHLR